MTRSFGSQAALGGIELSIRPNVQRLLQRPTGLPSLVFPAKGDLLAQNPLAKALVGDLTRWP